MFGRYPPPLQMLNEFLRLLACLISVPFEFCSSNMQREEWKPTQTATAAAGAGLGSVGDMT